MILIFRYWVVSQFQNDDTLWEELRLEIDRLEKNGPLQRAVRVYSDTLSDWLGRSEIPFFLYNQRVV